MRWGMANVLAVVLVSGQKKNGTSNYHLRGCGGLGSGGCGGEEGDMKAFFIIIIFFIFFFPSFIVSYPYSFPLNSFCRMMMKCNSHCTRVNCTKFIFAAVLLHSLHSTKKSNWNHVGQWKRTIMFCMASSEFRLIRFSLVFLIAFHF